MDFSSIITAGVVIALGGGATYAILHFRKKNREKLFTQIYESSRQVPKKQKHSFILLMFKETVISSKLRKKDRAKSNVDKLNNPKYLNLQLMQMTKVLNDKDNVTNKDLKKSLVMLNDYLAWEKELHAKSKETVDAK